MIQEIDQYGMLKLIFLLASMVIYMYLLLNIAIHKTPPQNWASIIRILKIIIDKQTAIVTGISLLPMALLFVISNPIMQDRQYYSTTTYIIAYSLIAISIIVIVKVIKYFRKVNKLNKNL